MTRKFVIAGLMLILALSLGIVLKASDKPATQPAVTAFEAYEGVLQLKPNDVIVKKGKKFKVGGAQTGFYLNVMQDCWTTDIDEFFFDPEMENYILTPDNIVFVWKHKIFEGCGNYLATIVGLPCEDGKPSVAGRVAWVIPNIQLGYIDPGYEYIFGIPVSGIPEGHWDWFIVTECNDTNGAITPPLKDGDIDDVIGANLGVISYPPMVYGPEPVEVLDPHPGGFPPGRLPGEEGACRCWCFMVEAEPQCPSMEGIWDLAYDWDCDGSWEYGWIEFYANGTFEDEFYTTGTWTQNGCDVDWVYDNSTHYWGVMVLDGSFMSGDMLGFSGRDGCWEANATDGKVSKRSGNETSSPSGKLLK